MNNEIGSELARVAGSQNATQSQVVAEITSLIGEVAVSNTQPGHAASEALAQNSGKLDQLRAVLQSHLESVTENTKAVTENTSIKGQSVVSQIGDAAKGMAGGLLGGGSFLSPLIGGLLKLFGGGDDGAAAPAALPKFSLPDSLRVEAGVLSGALMGVDHGQGGEVRQMPAGALQQITVQVQAIDSRSFLDHSDAIAAAVKKAMLDSNSLNDVVSEL